MDSNKERDTLEVILYASIYASSQKNAPAAMSLLKPLFTLESCEGGDVHPDFILSVAPAGKNMVGTIIIETMGNDSDEYIQRKAGTHSLMAELGNLITDPPGWPEATEITFNRHLLSHIFKTGS